jgi:hypothetical protein
MVAINVNGVKFMDEGFPCECASAVGLRDVALTSRRPTSAGLVNHGVVLITRLSSGMK